MLNMSYFLDSRAPIAGARSPSRAAEWIGSAIGAGANLLGGLLGFAGQKSANKANLRIAREQMKFNSEEAKKQRDWQEEYYKKYSSPIAQSAQYRSAGLNPYLSNIQPGSVASGAQAQSSELPIQQNEMSPLGSSFGSAADSAIAAYNSQTSRRSQESQESLNKSIENLNASSSALNDATAELREAEKRHTNQDIDVLKERVNNLKFVNEYLDRSMESRVRQQYNEEIFSLWRSQSEEWNVYQQRWQFFNLNPVQIDELNSRILNNTASAYKSYADGDLSYGELKVLPRKVAALETSAYASLLNAKNGKEYNSFIKPYFDSQSWSIREDARGKQAKNDYFLNDKIPPYIARDTNLKHYYDNVLEQSDWMSKKMMEEPELIRSQADLNRANRDKSKAETKESYTRSAKNVVETGAIVSREARHWARPWSRD
nr:MAG TPA: minor capsid protein [Microviridae sp.]